MSPTSTHCKAARETKNKWNAAIPVQEEIFCIKSLRVMKNEFISLNALCETADGAHHQRQLVHLNRYTSEHPEYADWRPKVILLYDNAPSRQYRPDNIVRNRINYILIKNRQKNGIKGIKAYPGTDIGSDHNPVVGNLDVKLKKVEKEWQKSVYFKTKIYRQRQRSGIIKVEQEETRYTSPKPRTEKILLTKDNERTYKNKNIEKHKQINGEIRKAIWMAKEKVEEKNMRGDWII